MTKNTKKSGFTLVELLIATAIFASVMVLALSTFTWSANYYSKISEMRKVTGDGRSVIFEMTNEIRLANGSLSNGSIGEITFMKCVQQRANTDCAVQADAEDINGIRILNQDQNNSLVYYSSRNANGDFTTRRAELDFDVPVLNIANDKFNIIHDSNRTSLELYISGKTFSKKSRTAQPYVNLGVHSKSKDFDALDQTRRYKFDFNTVVETRDYDIL